MQRGVYNDFGKSWFLMKKAVLFGLLAILLFAGCVQQEKPRSSNAEISAALVEAGDSVRVEYEGRLLSGEVFDSSRQHGSTLEFVAGAGTMIRGFDEAVIGMRLGEEKTVEIPPQKAYGFRDESKVVEIPKEQFPDWNALETGMPVHSETGVNGRIVELKENSAIVDFNHELAGKTLVFWIKVVGIEKSGMGGGMPQ
jgi:FKBP-type peptidyl-prolyl cis-trans isomerase 2